VTSQIQDIQTWSSPPATARYSQSDREALATELEGRLTDMLGLANTADGTGGYLFSGYQSTTQPFSRPDRRTYQGDQGQRSCRSARRARWRSAIPAARSSSHPDRQRQLQTVMPASTNTGAGIVSPGAVVDSSKLTGHNYDDQVQGGRHPGRDDLQRDRQFGLARRPTCWPTSPTRRRQIAFDGMSMDVKGAPADGDSFSVKPSAKEVGLHHHHGPGQDPARPGRRFGAARRPCRTA
jgi:flagellar hook-associated protein 3 FlgL